LCLELLDGQFDKRVLREEGESLPEGNPFGSFLSVKLLQKSEEYEEYDILSGRISIL
jgi:hypothetical protein